jgi:leucyl-tRNA synthetase
VFHSEQEDPLEVFTTRPDTLWGATFMVLAPEHPLVEKITSPEQRAEVEAYVSQAVRQTDIQRESADTEKTGVFTGGYAINPVNQQRIPIWIADYVLMSYGTGAIMAVPAHDQRDFEFALKFGLPILPVIAHPDSQARSYTQPGISMKDGFAEALQEAAIPFSAEGGKLYVTLAENQIESYIRIAGQYVRENSWVEVVGSPWLFIFADETLLWDSTESEVRILSKCRELKPGAISARTIMEMLWDEPFYRPVLYHAEYGPMIHSGALSGTPGDQAVEQTITYLESQQIGKRSINYRLRDWLISRQRYWGAPIPMIHCDSCGVVPVPEDLLPVLLPDQIEWRPTGESPLKLLPDWKNTRCPVCDEPAVRETDTMDTFMCSSWYHLRYLSPDYDQGPFDPEEYAYWMPVDTYTGGIEHATMHLIYTRFFHKALRDMGITQGSEPMMKLRNQGIVLGEDSEKMSKSRGNVVAPDVLVERYGADTVRAYLMFFARWDQGGPWNSSGIEGSVRWLRRVWTIFTEPAPETHPPSEETIKTLRRKVHQTLRQVTHNMENFDFNTIISGLMELLNEMYKARGAGAASSPTWDETLDLYLRMLAPVTPHIAEELWARQGKSYSIHQQSWPTVDEAAAAEEEITLVVQVNGKLRDRIQVPADISDEEARAKALASETVEKFIEGAEIRQVIIVSGRLVNIVL